MSIILLAFGGYLGGLLVVSRTLRWMVGLREALRAPGMARTPWFVPVFLHSGPWILALAIAGVWRVASLGLPELLWALIGGIAFGMLFIVGLTVRRKPSAPVPLTPELLARKRHEFFFFNIAFWTIVQTIAIAWSVWSTLDRDYPLVIITAICAPLGGWLVAWFMWQWYGVALEVAEKRRHQRAERVGQA